jgi:leucyl aminopeptidase (aminopeptidase T)
VLEDEKVIGTAHIAFGTSAGLGGVNVASVHIDGVLRAPTVELDGVRVVDRGRLLG